MMIRTLLRKLKFKPNEFSFRCALPQNLNIVISLSQKPDQISLAITAIHSLIEFFSGEKYLIGPETAAPLLSDFLFRGKVEFISDAMLQKSPFEAVNKKIDLIWDLTRPPTLHANLPLYISGVSYRISTDPETYPYYNIILAPDPDADDISYFERQLKLLNVPISRFKPNLRDLAKKTVWDYLIFKGHGEKHVLVVMDLRDSSLVQMLETTAVTAFPTGVTFASPHESGEGVIDLSPLGPEGIAATLSLADIFISDSSLYLGIAALMKLPILLMNSSTKLPNSLRHKVWNTEMGIDSLVENLKELLG